MPTEGSKGRWVHGFTPVERFLIFAAPLLAGLLTFNHHWWKVAADERVAETARQERLVGDVNDLRAQLKLLGDKLAVLEKFERDRRFGNAPAEVAASLPAAVSISEYVARAGVATIKGTANSFDALSTFVQKLKASNYFSAVSIKRASVSQSDKFATVTWELTCNRRDPFESMREEQATVPKSYDFTDVPDQYRPAPARYDLRAEPGVPHTTY